MQCACKMVELPQSSIWNSMTEMDDNWRQSLYGQFFLQEIPNDCRISSTKSCDCCRALSLCILRIFANVNQKTHSIESIQLFQHFPHDWNFWEYSIYRTHPSSLALIYRCIYPSTLWPLSFSWNYQAACERITLCNGRSGSHMLWKWWHFIFLFS